eukprot:PhM_4_TR3063/c0_g1_i1/m.49601
MTSPALGSPTTSESSSTSPHPPNESETVLSPRPQPLLDLAFARRDSGGSDCSAKTKSNWSVASSRKTRSSRRRKSNNLKQNADAAALSDHDDDDDDDAGSEFFGFGQSYQYNEVSHDSKEYSKRISILRGEYDCRPLSLRFTCPETEERFCRYLYETSGFWGGKMYIVVILVMSLTMYLILPKDPSLDLFLETKFVFFHFTLVLVFLIGLIRLIAPTHFRQNIERYLVVYFSLSSTAYLLARPLAVGTKQNTNSDLLGQSLVLLLLLRARFFAIFFAQLIPTVVITINITVEQGAVETMWCGLVIIPLVLLYILEIQSRIEFAHIDRTEQQMKRIELHTQLMQNTLVAAFPATAAIQLLESERYNMGGRAGRNDTASTCVDVTIMSPLLMTSLHSGRVYNNTALVVTDAAGFTAWTTRTDASIVIGVLGRMFAEFDAAAETRGVEKVGTVGDSFFGAVFGGDGNSDRISIGCNVLRAIHFAIDVCRLPHQLNFPLRNRVGVHIGDVFGGFVGLSPPVFDLFGRAVYDVKRLESSGEVSRVHLSSAALTIAQGCGHGNAVDVTPTFTGYLLSSWSEEMLGRNMFAGQQQHKDGPPDGASSSPDVVVNSAEFARAFSDVWMRRSRSVRSGFETETETINSSVASSDDDEPSAAEGVEMEDDRDEDNGLKEEEKTHCASAADGLLARDRYLRTFKNKDIEREYHVSARSLFAFQRNICSVFSFGLCYFVIILIVHGCFDGVDKNYSLAMGIIATAIVFQIALLLPVSRWVVFFVTFLSFQVSGLLLVCMSIQCFPEEDDAYLAHNMYGVLVQFRYLAPLFCFTIPRTGRLVSAILTYLLQIFGEPLLREYAEGDGFSFSSYNVIVTLVIFVIMAFVIEETLRSGFSARKRIELELTATSKYAVGIRAGLEVMLPRFVARQVLERDTKRALRGQLSQPDSVKRGGSVSNSTTSSTNHTTTTQNYSGSDIDEEEEDNDLMIWDYNMIPVAFISFEFKNHSDEENTGYTRQTHAENTYERVAPILDEMERTVLRHGVMKVKTTNTTMLLVAGANFQVGVVEGTRAMCRAVLDVMQWVLSPHMDLEYRAGIHCGACFGAVLGTHGLTFDVFGDTVNTASRVMSTAPTRQIHVSTVAVDCLGGAVHGAPDGAKFSSVDAVHMKGKGSMNVFRLEDNVASFNYDLNGLSSFRY